VKLGGIERRRLALEDMLAKGEHVLRNLDLADVAEINRLVPDLIRVSERCAEQALAPRLQHDHALTLG
jgi:predicted nucleotidyltransferase